MNGKGILVLNAGSSSIKFSAVRSTGTAGWMPQLRGQIEGIHTSPHFIARTAQRHRGRGKELGRGRHARTRRRGRLILPSSSGVRREGIELEAVGPSCRARRARLRASRCESIADVLAGLENVHSAGAAAPAAQPGADPDAARSAGPICRRWRASIPRSTRTNPAVAQRVRDPGRICMTRACAVTDFTGCRTSTSQRCCPSTIRGRRRARRSCAHLGNGSSMCAIEKGASIASTMGFTALDGLAMGTRCGAIDPGVLLYLMDERKMDARAIEKLLYQQSGLLGVSGISSDMRKLLDSNDPRAKLAVDLFVYRIRPRAGLAGGRARGPGRAGLHGRHRREQRGDPRARVPRCGVARRDVDPAANRPADRASARKAAGCRPGSSRPTRS